MYKVFIEEKAFYLVFNVKKNIINNNVKIITKQKINRVLELVKSTDDSIVVNFKSNEDLKRWIQKEFHFISAAGGLVLNDKKETLFIFRNGKWDFPKGKIEKGENKKNAAVREVEEECGIISPVISKYITTTYHIYYYKDKIALKESIWYLMNYKGNDELKPQEEEGITDVKWLTKPEITKALKNSFCSIQDVIDEFNDGKF
jgi:8-oxo-dGTP pyrophosphatase MutT (NUDIX family)